MATNCEDVSARMVELLYGELPADARSGVDAHVAGCARCRSELEGLQKTRVVTRRALDESPPPRARVEILRRAAEHLAAQQQQPAAAAAAAAIAPAAKPKQAAEPERSSLWDWLRSRWTLPSLATVGAVALLVIGSRVLLEPEKMDYKGSPEFQREARQAAAPVAAPAEPALAPAPTRAEGESFGADKDTSAAKPTPAAEPAPEAKMAARARMSESSAARGKAKAKTEAKPSAASSAPARPSGPVYNLAPADSDRGDKGRFAPPPPPKPVTGFKMEDDAPSSSAGSRRASAPSKDDSVDNLLERAEKAPAPAKGGGASANLGGLGAGVGGGGKAAEHSLAKERPPQEARAPRVAESAAAPAAPPPAVAMQPSPAPAPVAPVRREAQKKAKRATAADEESAAAPEEGKVAAGKTKASTETAGERANRLFTEGRWAEAAAAYRELLRRDPNNTEAARWRQRLAIAEAALESRRPTEPAQAAPPAR